MNSDTPRTDALYASDFHRWDGEPPDDACHRMTDHARELERELSEARRLAERLETITDRDLSPDRRTLANYWEARFHAAWRETANANRGLARLLRRLEGAKERIAALHSDAAMLREENARLYSQLIKTNLDC